MAAIALLSLLFPLSAVVVGKTTCPTPTQVNEKLARLGVSPATPLGQETHEAVLSRNAQGLLLTLRFTNQTALAERQFSAQASCEDLAAAAAVVIATWWNWDIGIAIQLGRAASSMSPGAWIEASAGRQERLIRMVLSGFWQGDHELSLGRGEALWRRTGAALGPRLEMQKGSLLSSVEVLAYAAYLQLGGRNQPQNASDASVDAGGMFDLRVGFRFGKVVPWLSLGASYSHKFPADPVRLSSGQPGRRY